MKTHKNLYSKICTFENLLLAAQKAQKGKRFQENVADFNFHLEANLHQLLKELQTQTYQPGAYKEFYIFEPKPRMISAAPYRDRVSNRNNNHPNNRNNNNGFRCLRTSKQVAFLSSRR